MAFEVKPGEGAKPGAQAVDAPASEAEEAPNEPPEDTPPSHPAPGGKRPKLQIVK
jgi:hypothetical protein